MTPLEKKICQSIQGDLPVVTRPFREIAGRIGADEKDVLAAIRVFMRSGVIRKIGAILRHEKAGFDRNAMVVWAAPQACSDEAGSALAAFKEVTHCYERTPAFQGKYGLFTMVHFKTSHPDRLLAEMAGASGISDYKILYSEQEFKKSSMNYF